MALSNGEKTVLGLSGVSLATVVAIAFANRRKPAPHTDNNGGTVTLDDATEALLATIDQDLKNILTSIQQLPGGGGTLAPVTTFTNATGVVTASIGITKINTPVQLTSQVVANGCKVTIIANPNNSGIINVFPYNSITSGVPLTAGRNARYQIANWAALQISGTFIGDSAIITSEIP